MDSEQALGISTMDSVLALSIRQPFARLILRGIRLSSIDGGDNGIISAVSPAAVDAGVAEAMGSFPGHEGRKTAPQDVIVDMRPSIFAMGVTRSTLNVGRQILCFRWRLTYVQQVTTLLISKRVTATDLISVEQPAHRHGNTMASKCTEFALF